MPTVTIQHCEQVRQGHAIFVLYCVKQGYVWNVFVPLFKLGTEMYLTHHLSHTLMPLPPRPLYKILKCCLLSFRHKESLQYGLQLG